MNWTNHPTLAFFISWVGYLLVLYFIWWAAWRWNVVDRIFAVPMWLFTRMVTRLSKTHPWHGRRFALEDWRRNRTLLTRQCDLLAWCTIICIPSILYRLLTR